MDEKKEFLMLLLRLSDVFKIDDVSEEKLLVVLKDVLSYFNSVYKTNFKFIETTASEFDEHLAAFENKITVNCSNILAIRNASKEHCKDYSPDYYDDYIFSLYIMSSIYHEFVHCLQFQQIENGEFSEQIYFNLLENIKYLTFPYVERLHESEAYDLQANIIFYWIKNGYLSDDIVKIFNKHIDTLSFLSKNVGKGFIMAQVGRIPFVSDGSDFVPTSKCINDGLVAANIEWITYFLENSPQLFVGLGDFRKVKTPTELVEQYFSKSIMFRNQSILALDDEEIDELLSVYVYLLAPNITPHVYSELCDEFDVQNMEKFLKDLDGVVIKKIKELGDIYRICKKWYSDDLKFDSELNKPVVVNWSYIHRKRRAALVFYMKCHENINNVLTSNKKPTATGNVFVKTLF